MTDPSVKIFCLTLAADFLTYPITSKLLELAGPPVNVPSDANVIPVSIELSAFAAIQSPTLTNVSPVPVNEATDPAPPASVVTFENFLCTSTVISLIA
jgi:hypothetical protein